MKQTYVKPTIVIERFSLAQNIAYGCAPHNGEWGSCTWGDKSSCGWALPDGSTVAWALDPPCTDIFGVDDEIYGICYNNPGGGMTIFSS